MEDVPEQSSEVVKPTVSKDNPYAKYATQSSSSISKDNPYAKYATQKNTPDADKVSSLSSATIDPKQKEALKEKALTAAGYDHDVDYGFSEVGAPAPKKESVSMWDLPKLAERAGKSLKNAFIEGNAFKPRDEGSLSIDHIRAGLSDEYKELKKMPAQLALQRADNPAEAKLALEQVYGSGNVGQDKGGRWWAKIDGKKQAIFGGGQGARTAAEKFVTGVAATTPSLAGSTAAEEYVGAPLSEATFGASIPLAWFAGGAAGKGIDEALKGIQGLRSKTSEQGSKALVEAGNLNAAGNLLPKAGGMAAKGVANIIPNLMSKATKSGKEMVNELLGLGYRPPLATATPGLSAAQYDVMVRNAVMGDPKAALNVAKLKREMIQVLRDSGVPNDQVYATLKKVTEKKEALSTSDIGESLTKVSREVSRHLKDSADASLKLSKQLADQQVSVFKKLASTSGPIARDTAEAISKNRKDMSAAFGAAYKHLDAMTNSEEIVPLSGLKNAVYDIVKDLPPDKVPTLFSNILKMENAEVSVMKMHEIRSALREAEQSSNLTPTPENFRYGEAADWADRAFKTAEKDLKGTPYENAIPFMREVDKSYGKAIAPYKDSVINKLVFDMKSGLQPNPEVTARLITQEGYTERTKAIIGMMSPELKRKVGSAYIKSIFDDAQKLSGSNEFLTSGRALLKTIDDKGDTLGAIYDPVYGKEFTTRLKNAVKDLAAVDGKVDMKALESRMPNMQPGALLDALNTHLTDLKNIDNFVKNSPLEALDSTNPQVVDRALRTIAKPGDEATLAYVANALDPKSKEWKSIQNWAIKDLLSKAIYKSSTGNDIITGKTLKLALREYTEQQQKLLFPTDIMNKLVKISERSDFLFPLSAEDFGGSLAAAAIKGGVPFREKSDLKYLWLKFYGWLADKPQVVDYLVNGLDNPSLAERVQTQGMMQELFNLAIVEQGASPGRGKPKDQ